MPVFQVSAYRGDNVEHIFKQLIIRIMSDKNLVDELISKATIRKNPTQQGSNRSSRRDTFALDSSDTRKDQERMRKKRSKCCK